MSPGTSDTSGFVGKFQELTFYAGYGTRSGGNNANHATNNHPERYRPDEEEGEQFSVDGMSHKFPSILSL